MIFTFNIKDSDDKIVKNILTQFKNALNKAISGSLPSIKKRIGELTKALIIATPEFDSIIRGQLRLDLGLIAPQYAMLQILDKLSQEIKITVTPMRIVGDELTGSMQIGIITDDYSNILNIPEAKYHSGQYEIAWLDWLLTKGNTAIIADYNVRYFQRPVNNSRTQTALMIKSKSGGVWAIPTQFSGTADDNFITRAFAKNPDTERLIAEILEEEITLRLF
jgi:hypothetical protein